MYIYIYKSLDFGELRLDRKSIKYSLQFYRIIYHKSKSDVTCYESAVVKTEKDREEAMNPGQINFHATEPRIQLYFLLGLVYAPVTPVLLPFIIIFFALAYLVFRHQV